MKNRYKRLILIAFLCNPLTSTELLARYCIAHRGLHQQHPENSVAAISAAIYKGLRQVEVDLRFTADGVAILYHDADIEGLNIARSQYSTLQSSGYVIDRFSELSASLLADSRLLLDLKDNNPQHALDLARRIAGRFNCEQVAFQSEYPDVLKAINTVLPHCKRYWVHKLKRKGVLFRPPKAKQLADFIESENLTGIAAKGRAFVDKKFVREFRVRDQEYLVWTIDNKSRIAFYQSLGVDGIISDNPASCQRFHQRK